VLSGDVLVNGEGNVWHLRKIDQELENIEQTRGHVDAGDQGARPGRKKRKTPLPRLESSNFSLYFLRVERSGS
jgi:hypothetical protein